VKVSDTSNTFHTILALCTCLYRSNLRKPVSMKQTKHSRKSQAQNLCSKCPPFTLTRCIQTTTQFCNHCCCDGGVVQLQQPQLTQQTFFQLLHIVDLRTVDPLLKDRHPRCCSPQDSNLANWMATSLEGKTLGVSLCRIVTVSSAR